MNRKPKRRRVAPRTADNKTALGIIIGEAYPDCAKTLEKGREYIYPRLRIEMCDPTAVQKVADYWNTSVGTYRATRGRCTPTPENPEGRTYRTGVEGIKAKETINRPELQNTQLHKKAKKKKCFL